MNVLDWLWKITGRAAHWAELYEMLTTQLEEKEEQIETLRAVLYEDNRELQLIRRENEELKSKAAQSQ